LVDGYCLDAELQEKELSDTEYNIRDTHKEFMTGVLGLYNRRGNWGIRIERLVKFDELVRMGDTLA
jgi:hypothetical protein